MIHSPRDEQEAAGVIAQACGSRTRLAVAGRGTKAAVGRPLQADDAVSSAELAGITLYEPAELVISARSGTAVSEVVRTLAGRGQELPFEPMDYRALLGSTGEPTIGAVAAMNISGSRRIMAGAARDSLLGVRFVNGRGEIIKSGGRVMKNVTGLDLVKLMAGSWGTLGLLTEVTFKVLPKPERSATLVLRGLDDRRAVEALCSALGSPFDVTGAAHVPAADVQGSRTLIRLEGFSGSIDYRLGEMRRLLKRCGAGDIIDGRSSEGLWQAVRDVTLLLDYRDRAIWRISCAPTRGPDITSRIAQVREARWFYDWGGGLVWLATPAGEDAGAADIRSAMQVSGGHATLVRAPEAIRAEVPVFEPLSPVVMAITRNLKATFDPAGILNPGRMYAEI